MPQTQPREVRLYGHLGRRFGRVHRFAVGSAGEAIRALTANYPGFDAALVEYRPGWHVRVGASEVASAEHVGDPASASDVIRIVPAVGGAKSALGQVLLGVALVAAAVMMPVGAFGFGSAVLFGGTTVAGLTGSIGLSLALGGVAQLLGPKPDHQAGSDAADSQKQSYVFSGPINTSQQGVGVPIVYGTMTIGSVVVSTGLDVRELPA